MRRFIHIFILIGLTVILSAQKILAQNISDENKKIEQHGSINLSLIAYNTDLIPSDTIVDRRTPSARDFSFTTIGNYTLSTRDQVFTLPVSFVLGNLQDRFHQSFNQFNVNPTYKNWLKVYLGYNNMTFSPFTLGGATFLGAGINLTPGKFRFGAMYGRFNKAIKVDSTDFANKNLSPTYERNGYSVKIGFGSAKNYVDLSLFHAKDKEQSLSLNPDSTVKPQENLCLGITSHQTFGKHVTWDIDLGAGAITRDLNGTSYEVNNDFLHSLNSFIATNASTFVSTALQTFVYVKTKHFNLKLGYRRVDPDYTSLGAYYFTSDIENFSVAPTFIFFKNKLRLSVNAYYQHNNIDPLSGLFLDGSGVQKKLSTIRSLRDVNVLTWSIINAASESIGIDLQNTVFSNKDIDTFSGINITNLIFGITPHCILNRQKLVHSIYVSATSNNTFDHNPATDSLDSGHTVLLNGTYSAFINSKGLTLTISGNNYNSHAGKNQISTSGITLGGSQTLMKKQILVNASATYNAQKNGEINSTSLIINAGSSYSPNIHHLASLNFNYLKNSASSSTSFYELKITASYVYKF